MQPTGSTFPAQPVESSNPTHLMIFDITHDSHFPLFMHHWMDQWVRAPRHGARLTFVVDHYALARRSDLPKLLEKGRGSVQVIQLSDDERRTRKVVYSESHRTTVAVHRVLNTRNEHQFGAYYDWQLFCEYADRLRATHSMIAHCDLYLPLVGCDGRAPEKFSGIYFAPDFHTVPSPDDAPEVPARRLREKFVLARALRHPNLHTLFFLDETVMDALQAFPNAGKAVYLPEVAYLPEPDPWQVELLRAESGEDRVTFLIFGRLSPRKGVAQFLAAVEHLPPELRNRVCIRLAGEGDANYELTLEPLFRKLNEDGRVRLLRRREYVPDLELSAFVHASDVIVTLYQDHQGPSNVSRIAALTGKPVLSSNCGLMAREVQTWGLGLTVNAADPVKIAGAIEQFVVRRTQELCNPELMSRFADRHAPGRFAETVFNRFGI